MVCYDGRSVEIYRIKDSSLSEVNKVRLVLVFVCVCSTMAEERWKDLDRGKGDTVKNSVWKTERTERSEASCISW